jgi:hypothetical protein
MLLFETIPCRLACLTTICVILGGCGGGTRPSSPGGTGGAVPATGGTSGSGGTGGVDTGTAVDASPPATDGPAPEDAAATPRDGSAGDTDGPSVIAGTVYFSNEGAKAGWTTATPQGGTIGRVIEVSDPVYKGSTAILTEQTYVRPQGAHSETILATAQKNGEDRYYGQAIYLPLDWNTIDENATFQQFSPEAPAGPWNLNWIQNDHIFIRVAGKHYDCGPISKGVWTRVVVRFKTTNPGIFEYWVDGVKKHSVSDVDLTILNGSPTMRWSSGIYVTWWRTKPPGPQLTRQIYHDHLRVAGSYEAADPASW